MLTTMGLTFFVCMALGVPIAFCLGVTAAVSLICLDMPLGVVAQRIFTGMDSFPLMAVPFFVLAGDLMNHGGTTIRLVRFSNALVGWIRGGWLIRTSWPACSWPGSAVRPWPTPRPSAGF